MIDVSGKMSYWRSATSPTRDEASSAHRRQASGSQHENDANRVPGTHPALDSYLNNGETLPKVQDGTAEENDSLQDKPPSSTSSGLWHDLLQSIYYTVTEERPPKLPCPYYENLKRLGNSHPEIKRALDFVTTLGYTDLAGERVFRPTRGAKGGDSLYLVECIEKMLPWYKRISCRERDDLQQLVRSLSERKNTTARAMKFVIVPQLSPVIIELLGHLLGLDFLKFARHSSASSELFILQQFFNVMARDEELDHSWDWRMEDSPYSFTVWYDFDLSSPARSPLDASNIANLGAKSFAFVRRQLRCWPETLSRKDVLSGEILRRFYYAQSRTTVNLIQRESLEDVVLIILTPTITKKILGKYYDSPLTAERNFFDTTLNSSMDSLAEEIAHIADMCQKNIAEPMFSQRDSPDKACQIPLLWTLSRQLEFFGQQVERDRVRTDYVLNHVRFLQQQTMISREDEERSLANARLLEDVLMFRLNELKRRRRAPVCKMLDRQQTAADEKDSGSFEALVASYVNASEQLETSITMLLERIRVAQNRMLTDQQSRLTQLQIEESRNSIKQNDQVRKLTLLAFFFIPISAVTSAFGMNAFELLQNPPHIWIPIVTVVAVTAFSLLVAGAGTLTNVARGLDWRVRHSAQRSTPRYRVFAVLTSAVIALALPFKLLRFAVSAAAGQGERAKQEREQPLGGPAVLPDRNIFAFDWLRAKQWYRAAIGERKTDDEMDGG